jgi:ATP-dependent Clp protease adaptor protein ClpS
VAISRRLTAYGLLNPPVPAIFIKKVDMSETMEGGSKTLPKKEKKLREPRDYMVVLLNDNYTTREFVVEVLELVFHLGREEAAKIMLKVHHQGRGTVGCFTWDIAQTKVSQVHALAREHDYPLRCIVEEA